jgi:hypothetical protein
LSACGRAATPRPVDTPTSAAGPIQSEARVISIIDFHADQTTDVISAPTGEDHAWIDVSLLRQQRRAAPRHHRRQQGDRTQQYDHDEHVHDLLLYCDPVAPLD